MENNFVLLNVVLNHIEEKEFNNQKFFVYTLTDFVSGNSFDIWSLNNIEFIDNMKLLLECRLIKFEVIVKRTGNIKLKPICIYKEDKK